MEKMEKSRIDISNDAAERIIGCFDREIGALRESFKTFETDGSKYGECLSQMERMQTRVVNEIRDHKELEQIIDLRVSNESKEVSKKLNMYVGCAGVLIALGIWPLIHTYTQYVTERINNHIVENKVDQTIKCKSAEMISNSVPDMISLSVNQTEVRLKTDFSVFVHEQVYKITNDAARLSAQVIGLSEKEHLLEKQLSMVPKLELARNGSRDNYDELRSIVASTNALSNFVVATVRGIEKAYEEKKLRRECFDTRLRTAGETKLTPEDYVGIIHADLDHNCDGAINELVWLGRKEFVATLVHTVKHSKRLNSVYLAIAGIGRLTEQAFPALGIDEVLRWWDRNSTNEVYQSPYEEYQLLLDRRYGFRTEIGVSSMVCVSNSLYDTVALMRKNPGFLPAARDVLLQIVFYPIETIKKFDEGRGQLYEEALEASKRQIGETDAWWNYKAFHDVFTGEFDDTVKKRLSVSPTFEDVMKRSGFYNPSIFNDDKFDWPSRRVKPSASNIPATPDNTIRAAPLSVK